MKKFLFLIAIVLSIAQYNAHAVGCIIPIDSTQKDFLKAYKVVLNNASSDYRFTSTSLDTALFPKWGEYSVYWVQNGRNQGAFVNPEPVPSNYSTVTSFPFASYDWQSQKHLAITYKANQKTVLIYQSDIKHNNSSANWEAVYFKNLFETYLASGISYCIGEKEIDSTGMPWNAQLLVIPAFSVDGENWKYYMDSSLALSKNLKTAISSFLAKGGTIYAEGNAAYFIEKLGYLKDGTVNYNSTFLPDSNGNVALNIVDGNHPLGFASNFAGRNIYTTSIPKINLEKGNVIASLYGNNNPVIFELKDNNANNGRIIINTALPTVGGSNKMNLSKINEARQLLYSANAVMYAFAKSIDVTRSEYNDLPDSITAGKNAVSCDRIDTFEVKIKVRNLTDKAVNNIKVTESIRNYFKFVGCETTGIDYSINDNQLMFSNINMPPLAEKVITYKLRTPDLDDSIRYQVNSFISWANYIYVSTATVDYNDDFGHNVYYKYRDYVDMMFSAKIVVDADLNWKNFLGLYYQPFRVFMIMENKERTSAESTEYVQYIPKDVPFYWTDNSLNIPILKTPGGKFVTVLKGSDDQINPEFDMDRDGHPDVWLDTASIYPKGYKIEETEVYWLNPWEHLRSGDSTYYEDIDHDGKRAHDFNGDGVIDEEEPGDKIRVWKVTWNIGKVAGYQYFDPYCYYDIWVDPPDLVPLSAGVAKAYNKLDKDVDGMFYPYSDLNQANLSDTSWTHWMERDGSGNIEWKQLIMQKIGNYEGFTFIDTAASGYKMKPTDICYGTVPQPHREFIAVLSLGGEEIDMTKQTPNKSYYSNLNYKTIFNENRTSPIRTTYTYYAPLPNPLQFEYLNNNFTITDFSGQTQYKNLPAYGKVMLNFDMDASTEYSYYWIRNAGRDVDYCDPSDSIDKIEKLGDGVFGYFEYDVPKGMGDYRITLPTKSDGSFDVDSIVKIDGKHYHKWIDNPNTKDSIIIYEDAFQYHIYIPQILIPPALDDDNFDGVDDWIDDRGDRFSSSTGFLHDDFMPGNGEDYPDYPKVPFKDDIYGTVTKGWYPGPDSTYGDDFYEDLGKTHISIKAIYEGKGKEGSVDISKGGWLVVEEIFGGSPWVIFSHTLSANAEGVNIGLSSSANPTIARFGVDTLYIKHQIQDWNEPHYFNSDFDPYHVSYGYGSTTITAYAGGKDACSLIEPNVNLSTIIDPVVNKYDLTLIPLADTTNPDLKDYPKQVKGCFLEARIEINNGTDDNWINTSIEPVIPAELKNTKLIMSYVAYPRPLVPAQVDPASGNIIHSGDELGSFKAAWRFNQPENEVLVKLGDTLNLMQPSRRAYFNYLFMIDDTLPKGIYNIGFKLSGMMKHYDGKVKGNLNFEVPNIKFSISKRDADGDVAEYQKIILGSVDLKNINTNMVNNNFAGLANVKWSDHDVNFNDFDSLKNVLPVVYNLEQNKETIDLSQFKNFPNKDLQQIYILEQGRTKSYSSNDNFDITKSQDLNFDWENYGAYKTTSSKITVSTIGPKINLYKTIIKVNGKVCNPDSVMTFFDNKTKNIEALVEIRNNGSSIADNTKLKINTGDNFIVKTDSLPANSTLEANDVNVGIGNLLPGESKQMIIQYQTVTAFNAKDFIYSNTGLIPQMQANYVGDIVVNGSSAEENFSVPDAKILNLRAYDFRLTDLTASENAIMLGDKIKLTAKISNGSISADSIKVKFYTVMNASDTILIGESYVQHIDSAAESEVEMTYTIPDSVYYQEFFAQVDPENSFKEITTLNNTKELLLPFSGPNWMLNLKNYPNPVTYKTEIKYVLPRVVKNLKMSVYQIDGTKVDEIDDLNGELGGHSFVWYAPNLPAGVYMLKFEASGDKGESLKYFGRLIKN